MKTGGFMTGGDRKWPVEVLGATGYVGQHLLALLSEHPWFRVERLTASSRSAGRPYSESVRWALNQRPPKDLVDMPVQEPDPSGPARLVFSAIEASAAQELEPAYARAGHTVVSNARSFRMEPDVPLVIPEVNPDHLSLLERQNWSGSLATNPNCSTIGLCMALKPLQDRFGIEVIQVATLQAVSGAGIPGLSSVDIMDNVIPFIAGEEEKLEVESRKILGELGDNGHLSSAGFRISAACNRVPVLDGHTENVSVKLEHKAGLREIREAWEVFRPFPQEQGLPMAPPRPLIYMDGPLEPQPRSARQLGEGMAVAVGGLRPCGVLDFKFTLSFHNAIRGAAGGTLLLAETMLARGDFPSHDRI